MSGCGGLRSPVCSTALRAGLRTPGEIRITLFHELGHLLGLGAEEVEAPGLG